MKRPYKSILSTFGPNLSCGVAPDGTPAATFTSTGDHAQIVMEVHEDRVGKTTVQSQSHVELIPQQKIDTNDVVEQTATGIVSRHDRDGTIQINDQKSNDTMKAANEIKKACNSSNAVGRKFHINPSL